MPEMHFSLRWPDGSESLCYSPSLVIEEHLTAGAAYPLDDFMTRTRTALNIASERVRAKFGFACSRAMGQLAELENRASHYGSDGTADKVTVLAFHRDGPPRTGALR